jgi:steroid delta-isomerase-like uncharacterized protein
MCGYNAKGANGMAIQEHKSLIERFNDAVWNQGNLDVIDEVIGPEFIWHSAPPGIPPTRDGLRMMIAGFRAAFSDAVSKVDEQIAEGDSVAWRWTFQGTHTGELMGIPGTGSRVTFAGVSIDRFGGGRSVERRDYADMLGLMQQLGAVPAPQVQGGSR